MSGTAVISDHPESIKGKTTPFGTHGSCRLCRRVNIERLTRRAQEGIVFDLHVVARTARKCRTCNLLFATMTLEDGSRDKSEIVRLTLRAHYFLTTSCLFLVPEILWPPGPMDSHFMLFTNKGDPAETMYGIPALKQIGTNTSSTQSLKTATQWLTDCLQGHPSSCGLGKRLQTSFRAVYGTVDLGSTARPTRLIDLFAGVVDTIASQRQSLEDEDSSLESDGKQFETCSKIIDGLAAEGPYVTLSYMWGQNHPLHYVTSATNLEARYEYLDESILPQTIKDAMHVARTMHIRYLWVDALCIVQGSEEDWLRESEKMGSIYGKAVLTSFAASTESCENSMFNEHSAAADHFSHQTTLNSTAEGSTLHFRFEEQTNWSQRDHARWSPLVSRAWCFQEDLLSARKLYFAADQLYWECDHLAASEDGLVESTAASVNHMATIHLEPYNFDVWYYLIEDYSKRQATVETDKLVAVAGLARRAAAVIESRYLAGLWEASVLEGLGWRLDDEPWGNGPSQHRSYCGPSWSWASRNGQVCWRGSTTTGGTNASNVEYVKATITLLGGDEFGAVTSAALTLRAGLFEVEISLPTTDIALAVSSPVLHMVDVDASLDDTWASVPQTSVFALPIRQEHSTWFREQYLRSLLVIRSPKTGFYSRIGIFTAQCCSVNTDHDARCQRLTPLVPMVEVTLV